MIFKAQPVASDTCGNTWDSGAPKYYQASCISKVWEYLGKPSVWIYMDEDGCHNLMVVLRTADVKIAGPQFNLDFQASLHTCTMFHTIGWQVTTVDVIKL